MEGNWRNAAPAGTAARSAIRASGGKRVAVPGRVDIAERPGIVEEKSRVGDWEGDMIVGARHRGAVLSLVDHASRFTLLALLGGRTAGETGGAMRRGRTRSSCRTTAGSSRPTGRLPGCWKRCSVSRSRAAA